MVTGFVADYASELEISYSGKIMQARFWPAASRHSAASTSPSTLPMESEMTRSA